MIKALTISTEDTLSEFNRFVVRSDQCRICAYVCLSTGPRWQGGPIILPKYFAYDGFLLMWCKFKFEDVLFRSDSRHNDRVDSLWECATFRVQVRGLIT